MILWILICLLEFVESLGNQSYFIGVIEKYRIFVDHVESKKLHGYASVTEISASD